MPPERWKGLSKVLLVWLVEGWLGRYWPLVGTVEADVDAFVGWFVLKEAREAVVGRTLGRAWRAQARVAGAATLLRGAIVLLETLRMGEGGVLAEATQQ